MTVPSHDLTDEQAQRQKARAPGGRRGPPSSVLSLHRMAGNRAVTQLLRTPVDEQVPEGVTAGANALPAGSTVAHPESSGIKKDRDPGGGWTAADGTVTHSGYVGGVDRILLEGMSGTQGGKSWGKGGTGPGKAGHRGRAVALVPQSLKKKKGGPISVVVHLHGIDIGPYKGTSEMRTDGPRPEDVEHFQLPQQLEAFSNRHPGSRVVVLMPLGATVKAGKGFDVDFGLRDMDTFVDECLGQLGISTKGDSPGTVYLSAHSGGGFEISRLVGDPSRLPHRYRFGGVFGFESFHGDVGTWSKLATTKLDEDLVALEAIRKAGGNETDTMAQQLAYVRDLGFRFAAFGGSNTGYTARLHALREAILGWFADKRRRQRLKTATGGSAEVLNQLWRNYQANYADEKHMAALAKDSHFESILESLPVAGPLATPARAATPPPPPPKPAPKAATTATATTATTKTAAPVAVPATPAKGPEHHPGDEHKADSKPAPVKVHNPGPASKDRPFRLEHYPSAKDDIKLAAKEFVFVGKTKHTRRIAKPPAEYLPAVLERAKVPDADKWFDQFTSDLTFLGARLLQPVHKLLAEHLRKVEQELCKPDKDGGPAKDPAVVGKALGVDEAIAGGRAYPTVAPISMHMFGLAVDINYNKNPMVHPGSKAEQTIFARIGELLEKKPAKLTTSMTYAYASKVNKLMTDYFKLASGGKALDDKLADATGFWKGKDAETAKKQIEDDLKELSRRWQRGKLTDMIRTGGFLNVKEDLVRGMKMNWGGSYGDMMHFDLRDDRGTGQAIFSEIIPYINHLHEEAKKPDPLAMPAP